MIGFVPEEIYDILLTFADPCSSYQLGLTNKFFKEHVYLFYKKNADPLLRPGGEWHPSVKSKRTRTSLEDPHQKISYAPMGANSIVHQQCIGCKKRYRAAIHKDFGIIAHPQCLRPFLVNTFYFQKFGLNDRHFDSIPHSELSGYSSGYYGRGSYSYIAVWKDITQGIVPYEWTAHYLFHHQYLNDVRNFLAEEERKRREELEEKKRQQREKTQRIRHLFHERIKTLIEMMKTTLPTKEVQKVLQTGLPPRFVPRFFQRCDVPGDFFTEEHYNRAMYVVSHIHRLMDYLTTSEIGSLRYNDLGKDIQTLCRAEAQCVLGGIVEKIHQKHTPLRQVFHMIPHSPMLCECGNSANTRCFYRKCGVCCRGCRCHTRR